MHAFYLVLGLFLLLVAVLDLLWTTLWVDGSAGPLSARLTTWIWKGLQMLGGSNGRTLSLAGPLILTITLTTWIGLLWAGWTFLFAGEEGALIYTRDQEPITWSGRIFFVAYSIFTMGNGDFAPKDGFWQIAASLTTASGMLFVTLGVSYILSVLGAVDQKRSFANGVTGLGRRSEDLVRGGWNGKDLHTLDLPLNALATQLTTLTVQHKAYPILHYYHSESGKNASALAVAILDDALTLLRFGIPDELRPNTAVIDSARSSIHSYLQTLNSAFIQPADHTPLPPDLDCLRGAGIPTVSDQIFAQELNHLAERRRKLLGVVEADAWNWSPLQQSNG